MSGGQSFRLLSVGAVLAGFVVAAEPIEARADIIPTGPAPAALELELELEVEPEGFACLTLAQSCHELHTLHTFPFSSNISPGGRFGCVSLVVRLG